MQTKKKNAALEYLKKLGKSSSELIKDFLNDNTLVGFVGDRLVDIKEARENPKTIKELTETQKKKFYKWLDEDRLDDGSFEGDAKELFEDFLKGIKTGEWKTRDADEFASLFGDDTDYLFADDPSVFGESFNYKGGKMNINQLKNKFIKELKIRAVKESLEEISPIESLNNKVIEIKDDILGHEARNADTPTTEITDVDKKSDFDGIKEEILNTINAVSTNQKVENEYKEVLANALATLFASRCDYKLKEAELPSETVKELNSDMDSTIREVESTGAIDLGRVLDEKMNMIKDSINEEAKKDENPSTITEIKEEIKEGENEITATGEFMGLEKIAIALFAVPMNLAHRNMTNKLADKYGSNFIFKQPLVASSSLSTELVSKYAKALEVKNLIEMKGLIEATAAQMDGGSVVSRAAKGSKVLSPLNIELRNAGKGAANSDLSYDEIISAFSESGRDFFKKYGKTYKVVAESYNRVVKRNPERFLMINDIQDVVGRGEAGEFIEHRRNALPSFMELQIEYTTSNNDLDFSTDTRAKKTTLGLQIIPRRLEGQDIAKSLAEVSDKAFTNMVTTKDERSFMKKMSHLLSFWKSKGDKKDIAILKSNEFADIMNKIRKVKTPLFHLMISFAEYVEIKNTHGVDLMSAPTYKKVMESLPLISLTIVDEDSDILYLSEGSNMHFIKHSIDDFIDTVAQYEKELKTILKYNQI